MITGFESYTPDAWRDANGLMLSGKPHEASAHSNKVKVRRSGKWSANVSGVIGAAFLAISATLPMSSTAVTIATLVPDIQDFDVASPTSSQSVALSPIHEINKSFNKLFDSAREGRALIPSEGMRLLARTALKSQKQQADIDSWARNLANDIKDAND